MLNGCVCCTVRQDLIAVLKKLASRIAAGALHLDGVVIETTGMADPAPVAQSKWLPFLLSFGLTPSHRSGPYMHTPFSFFCFARSFVRSFVRLFRLFWYYGSLPDTDSPHTGLSCIQSCMVPQHERKTFVS